MRITCKTCSYEKEGCCVIKKDKVNTNKRRSCSKFILDYTKVKEKQHIQTIMRPDWYWDRKKYLKNERKLAKENELRDMVHPLTGNLDIFKSTAV